MASRPPNQASGTGSVPVRAKAKHPSASSPAGGTHAPSSKGRYSWGGGARVHSIPEGVHSDRVQAQQQLGTQDLTAPPTGAQAIREANAAADLQYGPQVQAAQRLSSGVQPWFQNFMAQVAGYANAAKTQMQPTLDQAAALAAPATDPAKAQAQIPQGIDPNSDAGRAAMMAAQGRAALAQLGNQALGTNAQSTQDYFGGLGALATRELPQQQAAAAQQLANAQSARGQAVQGFLTTARQNAQNYAIARGTLNLNTGKAAADATAAAGRTAETHRHNVAGEKHAAAATQAAADQSAAKGSEPNKFGVPADQWAHWSTSHRQRVIDAFGEKGGSGATDKEAAKHAKDISTATGKVQNTVTDIINGYEGYVGKTTDDTSKPKDPKTGQYPPRPLTDADIRAILGQNKSYTPQLIHIALMRKQGKKLGKSEIDYLHNLDPNFRVPREWLQQEHGVNDRQGTAKNRSGQPG